MAQRDRPVDGGLQQQLSTSVPQAPTIAFQAVAPVSPSYSRQLGRGRGHNILRRRGPHRGKFFAGAVASIVSLVTVLALLALCRTSQRRFNSRAAARRRLSDTDDESERSTILEECLDLEEELARRPTAPEHADDARRTDDRLAAMLYESSARSGRRRVHASPGLQGEVQFPPYKVPRLDEQWASPQYPQFPVDTFWPHSTGGAMGSAADTLDAGALDPAYSDLVSGGGEEQQHLSQVDKAPGLQQEASDLSAVPLEYYQASAAAGQTGFFSVGDAYSGDAALTPEAWLDDSVASMYPQTSQQLAVSTVWGNPVVEDLTAFSDAGSVASSSEGAGIFGPRTAGAEAGKGISAAEALDASVWDPVDSGLVFGGDEEQQHLSQLGKAPGLQQEASGFSTRPLDYYEASAAAGQPDSSSGGSAYSSDAALTPEGWLDESLSNVYPQTSQQLAVSTVWGNPVVEDLTAFSGAGSVGTSSEGAGRFGPRAAGAAAGKGISAAEALDASVWDPVDSGLVFGGDEEQQHLSQLGKAPGLQQEASGFSTRPLDYYEASAAAGQTDSSSGGSAYSSDAALTPEGWLDESLSNVYPQTTQQMEVSTVWRNAVVETASTATIDAGSVGTSSEGAGKIGAKVAGTAAGKDRAVPTVQSKAAQRRKRRAQAAAADLDAVKGSASAPAVRATSRGRTGQAEEPDLRQHPFVRLPAVNPEDIHKSFRVEIALTPNLNISSPMDSYVMMRSLFGQPSLTAEEVDTLIKESELLVNYALQRLSKAQNKGRTSYIIRKLASLFMVFDCLVCAIEILGSKMNTEEWWTGFVQSFETDYRLPQIARMQKTEDANKLINKLSSALAIYKQQRRPEPKVIIDMKRTILNLPYKGTQFSHPLWRMWIQDDKDFFGSNDDSESSSDDEEPGHGETKEP